MKELRRILSNRRLLLGLMLILLINGFLFVREQSAQNYGLNCDLPAFSSLSVLDGGSAASHVDAKAAYARYLQWLEKIKPLPLEQAVSVLEQEKHRLDDIRTISDLLGGADGVVSVGASLNTYREGQPDLVRQIENGEIDLSTVDLDDIAINRLLVQSEYLASYSDWLDTIQKNRDNMLSFSIFNDLDSFSGRNIIKTAREFEKLQGVELTLGANGAVVALMSFPLTDYFLLVVLLLFCASFLEERKAGLWSVVHAAPGGRLRLSVHRVLILAGVSVGSVLLLYGTDLAIGFLVYGGIGDLGRAAQSVEVLGRLPMLCSVGSFLSRYFLLRIAAAFFVGLLLWLLLIVVNDVKYTILVAAGVLVIEYGFYTFLPVQSPLNGLKYFNLFTYISLSSLYTSYLNIDLFGYPLGIRSISQLALFPLCLLLAAACVLIHCYKKPTAGKGLLGRIAYQINRVIDKGLCSLRLSGMELYKMLWIQKGLIIAALFVYAAMGLSFAASIPVNMPEESAARQYVTEFGGEITDDTFTRMDALSSELSQTLVEYEDAEVAYEKGEITDAQFNVYSHNAGIAQINQKGLSIVRSRAEELRDYGAEMGFIPWLMDEMPFESVYGTAAQGNQHRAAVVAVLALTLLLAGSMAYEQQSGMTFLLGTVPRGRGSLLLRKILLSVLAAVAVWAVVYGLELYTLISGFAIQTWDISVQNLSMLTQFPIRCSISGWLVILYGYRLWMLFCGALLVLLVSSWVKRIDAAYIAGCGMMLIPSLLYADVGIDVLWPLSYVTCVEAMSLLTHANGAVYQFLLWGAVLTIMAGVTMIWLFASTNKPKSRVI